MSLSNYLISLDFDLEETRTAVTKTEKLLRVHESSFIRATEHVKEVRNYLFTCEEIAADKRETLRDTSKVHAALKQRLGEFQSERFLNDEELENWKEKH